MKKPKGVKYKPYNGNPNAPDRKYGPYGSYDIGGPPPRKFHGHKAIQIRDFKDGLNYQDNLNDLQN